MLSLYVNSSRNMCIRTEAVLGAVKKAEIYTLCSSSYLSPHPILTRLLSSSIGMSWGPYPADSGSSGSTSANQATRSHYYGPSGVLELIRIQIILNCDTLSIAFRPC